MTFHIIGDVDKSRLFCAGSFTKLLTTYCCLSFLAERFELREIVDSPTFLNEICRNQKAKDFLALFQKQIGGKFSIRDLCSFYTGLPYTFDVSEAELEVVEGGQPFKHHSILSEKTFWWLCENNITPVYANECKFHYSEIAIIFLAYVLEQAFEINIEDLFEKYILAKFKLTDSLFSRFLPASVFKQDLSDQYDYPSIAILDHGYFCYSNGFYTTLNDMKLLLENLVVTPVFQVMTDLKSARAASNRLLNGLTVEIRLAGDDVVYGYEGLSFSGCNCWAYSTQLRQGYLTFSNSEEEVYKILYDEQLGYKAFDKVPAESEAIYHRFIENYHPDRSSQDLPLEFQGKYLRVNINEKTLTDIFIVGATFIVIRNPDEIKYPVVYAKGVYRVQGKDNVPNIKVGLLTSKAGNRYMSFDGTLYKKIAAD
jgi:CubicO group peptidase (beta-lactamase class C family)